MACQASSKRYRKQSKRRLHQPFRHYRLLRARAGYTQAELARILDVDRSAVAQWENGLSQPRMGNVRRLAEIFDVKVSSLLDGETGGMPGLSLVPMRPLADLSSACPADVIDLHKRDIEVPASLLAHHPKAQAVLVEGDWMDRVIPKGLAAIYDPDRAPENGDIALVEDADGNVLLRRWYRGSSTLMLVADSHAPYDDIVVRPDTPARLIGTVVWVQSPDELSS